MEPSSALHSLTYKPMKLMSFSVLGMFWKQACKKAALCGLVVGEALVFYLMLNQMDPLPVLGGHFNAGFIALAANFIVFVLVSAVTKNGKTRLV